MKIVALVILSCSIPSICSAHSGAVVSAVANYLPLIAPLAAGGFAGIVKFIRNLFKKDKSTENEATKKIDKTIAGTIRDRKQWGQFITENERGRMYTTASIERDIVESLIIEFGEYGYNVKSIEPAETALIYLRNFIPQSYDHPNKLVLWANDKDTANMLVFTKDAPALYKRVNFYAYDDFAESVEQTLYDEAQKAQLKSPQLILIGDVFKDVDEYVYLCEKMASFGFQTVDIYSLWDSENMPIDGIRVIPKTDKVITSAYGVCIALMLRLKESKPENFKPFAKVPFLSGRNKHIFVNCLVHVAVIILIASGVITGLSGYEYFTDMAELSNPTDATTGSLTSLTTKRDLAGEKINAINSVDDRYNEIFKFIAAKTSATTNIISVDTIDMIPVPEVSDSNYAETTEQPETQAPELPVKKALVVRGYSINSDGPAELYRSLRKTGLGETKLVGVEQIVLPSGETLFAFEMTVDVV